MTDEPPKPPDETPGENIERLADHRRRRRPSRVVNVTNDQPAVAARLARAHAIIGDAAPYEPVGFSGNHYYVLGSERQLVSGTPRDFGGAQFQAICGKNPYLQNRYPRMRNGKPVEGFVVDRARYELICACHEMGHWEPSNIRSVGAWLGADGDLILHRGDHLNINGQVRPLGRVGEFVYIPGPPLPPLPKVTNAMRGLVAGQRSPAEELLDRLETFGFARGTFDAFMVLAVICAAIMCGALKFRPHCFLIGEMGTGKSTLQAFICAVLGADGIVPITDATSAGIWQALRNRSIAVSYDEFEAEADPKKQDRVIALARQSSTGGIVRRGSSQHTASEFPILSSFIMSCIIAPPLKSEDASRFVQITTTKALFPRAPFSLDRLQQLGLELTAVLAERWKLLNATVLPTLRTLMTAKDQSGRLIDLYGTLISLASVALYDDVERMNLPGRLASHQMTRLLADAAEEQQPEYRRCIDRLSAHRTEKHRANSTQLGELIAIVVAALANPATRMQASLLGEDDDVGGDEEPNRVAAAKRTLAAYGLKVVALSGENGGSDIVLQIAHNNPQLAEVYEDSRWRTMPESATGGGWTQAAKRAPGATVSKAWFRGVQSRCVNVPIALVLQPGTSPRPSGQPADEQPGDTAAGLLH
jgi:hypothetical protein